MSQNFSWNERIEPDWGGKTFPPTFLFSMSAPWAPFPKGHSCRLLVYKTIHLYLCTGHLSSGLAFMSLCVRHGSLRVGAMLTGSCYLCKEYMPGFSWAHYCLAGQSSDNGDSQQWRCPTIPSLMLRDWLTTWYRKKETQEYNWLLGFRGPGTELYSGHKKNELGLQQGWGFLIWR